jgi:hypothetical protein
MRISDDQSHFAWRSTDSRGGLLATSPAVFVDSAKIVPFKPFNTSNSPLSISSKEIQLELRFIGIGHRGLGLAVLNCIEIGKDLSIAIYLRDLFLTMDQFGRVQNEKFQLLNLKYLTPSLCPVKKDMRPTAAPGACEKVERSWEIRT